MTFGNHVRLRRATRNLENRSDLADACSSHVKANIDNPLSEERIGQIEEDRRSPKPAELELLATILFAESEDADRNAFIRLGQFAQRLEEDQKAQRKALLRMCRDAAKMIGGTTRAARSPQLHALRHALGALFDHFAHTELAEAGTMGALDGPHLFAKLESDIDRPLIDITFTNEGGAEARDVVLLMPGPVLARAGRNVPTDEPIEVTVRKEGRHTMESSLVQYADSIPTFYIQRLQTPDSRLIINSRILEKPKTWWDINAFVIERLYGEYFPFSVSSRDASVQMDTDVSAPSVLEHIRTSAEYSDHGFIPYAPERMREQKLPEVAIMSPILNDALWQDASLDAVEHQRSLETLEVQLRRDASVLRDVLKSKFATLRPEQRFFNEEKLCLGSDVISPSRAVRVFKGTYFHGFLTNELSTKQVSSRDPRPVPRFSGMTRGHYVESGGGYELAAIDPARASNHIGASVILFTGDHRIQFWRQAAGEHAIGKAAATGSGSCDWQDWAQLGSSRQDLAQIARNAMVRELREESGLTGRLLRAEDITCRLLGYFRWVRRGGKPEFVGIAKSSIKSERLWPDVTEVDAPLDRPNFITATDLNTLKREIQRVLLKPEDMSLPLWVALKCLLERCDAADVQRFLWP